MSRERALALADAIAAFEPFPPTILEEAGVSRESIRAEQAEARARLDALVAAIRGSKRGRPRNVSSLYTLPRDGVIEFRRSVPVIFVPQRLHRLARRMVAQAREKPQGRRKLTGAALEKRTEQSLDDRHLRRLNARLSREREQELRRLEALPHEQAEMERLRAETVRGLESPAFRAVWAGMLRF